MIQSEVINVLVVDDNDFFRRVTADKLSNNHGIRTETASSPGDALSVLREDPIDCLVSDYQMPSMDGLKLYRMVDERFDLPFILLTGKGDEAVASEAIGAGVDDYLRKDKAGDSDRLDILANRITNVVRQRQAQEKYELLVDNSPDDIAQVSSDGTILAANEEMAATYDLTQSELAGRTLVDILPTQVGRARVNNGRTAIEENRRVTFEDSFDGKHTTTSPSPSRPPPRQTLSNSSAATSRNRKNGRRNSGCEQRNWRSSTG